MLSHLFSIRAALLACTLLTQAMAADPIRIVFQNGREAARLVGYMPQEVMEERLGQFIA